MKLFEKDKEVEISEGNWPLAVDLFIKWGYDAHEKDVLEVRDLDQITLELSAWGIPWKRTKWEF